MKWFIIIIVVLFPLVAIAEEESPLEKISINEINIVKISAQDQRAIIKTPDKKLLLLKVGDQIGKQGKVIEIVKGRVVLEELTNQQTELVIIRFEKGQQKVQRIKKTATQQAQPSAPQPAKKKSEE